MNEGPLAPGISVVVPVYRNAAGIAPLLERLEAVLDRLGRPFEVILVDDGSPDESWRAIADEATRRSWLRGLRLTRNYGQHNALLCGVRAARHEITVTLDDDLQNPPEAIPALLAELENDHDVVYGTMKRRRHSSGHNLGSWILRQAVGTVLGARTARIVSPLRAFRTRLRDSFRDTRSPWVILDAYLNWSTGRFSSVPVEHGKRAAGETTYTLRKRLKLAFDLITGFSTLPLKIASLIGLVFTAFGAALLVYVFYVYFVLGGTVPGWAFLSSTIAIFSGAQLACIGIVGEYLARMFDRVIERPQYTVGESTAARDGRGNSR